MATPLPIVAGSASAAGMDVPGFILDTTPTALPAAVLAQARRCLLDLTGVAAAGSTTELSRIVRGHATAQFGAGGNGARMLFDGRRVSPAGAALAGGMSIDAFDAHDGQPLTKGHAGAAVLPGLLAFAEARAGDGRPLEGTELLASLAIGYEVSIRAGIALHASVPDYHTSGAWNALGVAAVGARLFGLDGARTRHALGIAEYHGPRSQMMRCIDHPTMVKDGSGWGAMAGVSAAYLARDGFTGAPAVTVEDERVNLHWEGLGKRWLFLELYFKPWPVCRWAQPAMEAAWHVLRENPVAPARIRRIVVGTFHEATRLHGAEPADTEQAQYSLAFPLAALVCRGRVGAAEITGAGLRAADVVALGRKVVPVEDAACNAAFPARRLARVRIEIDDGQVLESGLTEARGNHDQPLDDDEIAAKFHASVEPVAGSARADAMEAAVAALPDGDVPALLDLLLAAP